MDAGEWAVLAAVVFTGLWSGLLAMLTLVMHPMLARMSGSEFARFIDAFIPVARVAPINYAAVAGMVISPVVALIAIDTSETAFVLTAAGLALTIAGPLLVSNRLAEPNYDAMLAWNPDSLPQDWESVKARYLRLNWIRAFATWIAWGLFLAALVDLLR